MTSVATKDADDEQYSLGADFKGRSWSWTHAALNTCTPLPIHWPCVFLYPPRSPMCHFLTLPPFCSPSSPPVQWRLRAKKSKQKKTKTLPQYSIPTAANFIISLKKTTTAMKYVPIIGKNGVWVISKSCKTRKPTLAVFLCAKKKHWNLSWTACWAKKWNWHPVRICGETRCCYFFGVGFFFFARPSQYVF